MTLDHAIAGLTLLTMFAVMAWLIAHARTETVYRPLAIIAFFVGFPMIYGAMATATGTPKPAMIYNVPEGGIILGYKPETGKNIYVLIDNLDGAPVYYLLPWNSKTAEKIEEALKSGKGTASLRFHRTKKSREGLFDFDWPWDIPEPEVLIDPTEMKMPAKEEGNPMAGMRLAPGTGND
jgi:hypothetical protein